VEAVRPGGAELADLPVAATETGHREHRGVTEVTENDGERGFSESALLNDTVR